MAIRIYHILLMAVLTVGAIFLVADINSSYLAAAENAIYLLLLISFVAIVINIKFKNVFLELLNIVFVIFYISRIPFVINESVVSDVILRNVNPDVISSSLIVLAFQYSILIACIILVNPKIPQRNLEPIPETTIRKILLYSFIIIALNLINYIFYWKLDQATLNNFFAILSAIFPITSVLGMLALLLFCVEKSVLAKYRNIILIFFAIIILTIMYTGSKSGILQIMLALLLAVNVIFGTSFKISLRLLLGLIIAACLSVGLFFLGIGFNFYQRGQIMLGVIPDMLAQGLNDMSIIFSGVSYRIGFLDFFIEKYSNDTYRSVVNLGNYLMAVVDLLTPGFDVFNDVPLVSRAIYTVYHGESAGPNSEELTVFAESQILFGYFSFLVFLLILLALKIMLKKFKFSYSFGYYLFYFYVASLFYGWISGMGLDFTFVHDFVYKGIFVIFSIWLLKPQSQTSTA